MGEGAFVIRLMFLLGGLLLWAVQFLTVYGFTGLACARGLDAHSLFGVGLVPSVVLGVTLAALLACGAIGAFAVLGRGPGIADEPMDSVRRFWRMGTAAVAGFSVVAIVWTGLPALLITPCA